MCATSDLRRKKEWYTYYKSGNKPEDIPTTPSKTYADDYGLDSQYDPVECADEGCGGKEVSGESCGGVIDRVGPASLIPSTPTAADLSLIAATQITVRRTCMALQPNRS
jgi:hypothetical protein